MNENEKNLHNNAVKKDESGQKVQYAPNFDQYDDKEQAIIYILWCVHNKKLQTGSKLFLSPLEEKFGLSRTKFNSVRDFLSGAGLLVDQVIIDNKIPKHLEERYGIVNE